MRVSEDRNTPSNEAADRETVEQSVNQAIGRYGFAVVSYPLIQSAFRPPLALLGSERPAPYIVRIAPMLDAWCEPRRLKWEAKKERSQIDHIRFEPAKDR